MQFQLLAEDRRSRARAGLIYTDSGCIPTPIFMPVGTAGSVKAVQQRELEGDIGARIILGNTYHLYLRPGLEVLREAGGLHGFMQWNGPILTDSGGYQVYSLASRRKIADDGVTFKSHIDGSLHTFTPELAMDAQRVIGADVAMAFDECTPYPCSREYAERSMKITHRWLDRCVARFGDSAPLYGRRQSLFSIVQGGVFDDLRMRSAEAAAAYDLPGHAIGGLSVGEPHSVMYDIAGKVCEVLPRQKPRYLMGVGTPENLLECIALGVDMFDCVMPTRNARNGMLFTSEGVINIRNEKWRRDFTPIDATLGDYASARYSKAYLRHLVIGKEILGAQIASVHNLRFYLWLMEQAREHVLRGDFLVWKEAMIRRCARRL